jgi:hypothetical protein
VRRKHGGEISKQAGAISAHHDHFFHIFRGTGAHTHGDQTLVPVPRDARVASNDVHRIGEEVSVGHLVDEALQLLLPGISSEADDRLQFHFEDSTLGLGGATPHLQLCKRR